MKSRRITCGRCGAKVKCILVSGDENLKERDYMEDVGVDGRIIS
jgi:hypothetical protein